jgi:hypothetical protein
MEKSTIHQGLFPNWLLGGGLLLTGIGGGFAPWVWRESVALQLTAPGLAEFVKFLPGVRSGQIQIERLYFLLPLFVALLALPLFTANSQLTLPAWVRWGLRLATLPMALASLSPVWTPTVLLAPEFRTQTVLAAVAVGLVLLAPLLGRLPLRLLVILLLVGAAGAVTLPAWQFGLIEAEMVEAYHEPVSLGVGWWLTVGGVLLSVAGGVYRFGQ